jgi:hypothetical protein
MDQLMTGKATVGGLVVSLFGISRDIDLIFLAFIVSPTIRYRELLSVDGETIMIATARFGGTEGYDPFFVRIEIYSN